MYIATFFFFYAHPHPRNLPSFPTRRSSDLLLYLSSSVACLAGLPLASRLSAGPAADAALGKRSEEHTSELQSRLHLVCRLLLEKKKTNLPIDCEILVESI